jgi:hypothetical protein
MLARRFLPHLSVVRIVRSRATVVALAALVVALLAWGQSGAADPAAADDTLVPPAGLDFSIGVDLDGDTRDDCRTSGGPSQCDIPAGSTFALKAYLNSLPDKTGQYDGVDFVLEYAGLAWTMSEVWVWPDAVFCGGFYSDSGFYDEPRLGCSTFGDSSTYTGLMVTTDFRCEESGSIALVHGRGWTSLHVGPVSYMEGDGTAETLTIICAEPSTPAPTTTPKPTCTPTPAATPVPLMGDVDCGGWVNSIDGLLILQYHAALIGTLPCLSSADVNDDGRIDSIDAALTIQFDVGPIYDLPPEGSSRR